MADNLRALTTQEVLNKVFTDSSGNAIGVNSSTTKETLNAVFSTSDNSLNVALSGGTISGDVTISGDLTVNGSNTNANYDEIVNGNLVVSSGNKLGVGTETPDFTLHVHGASDGDGYIKISDGNTGEGATDGARIGFNSGVMRIQNFENSDMEFYVNNSTKPLVLESDGNATFSGHISLPDASGSGGVLKLGASEDIQIYHDGSNSYLDHLNTGNLNIRSLMHGGDIKFHTEASDGTQSTSALVIDSNGNIGIGVSSLETQNSQYVALQLGGNANIIAKITDQASNPLNILQNAYAAPDTNWKKIREDQSSRYHQQDGAHTFFVNNVTGAADDNITWATALTIGADANATFAGKIGIGTSGTPTQPLHIAHATDASIQLERVDTDVADGDGIGAILFRGGESSQTDIARIRVNADAAFTGSSSPTQMVFETTPSGATADTPALRIDSLQNIEVSAGALKIKTAGQELQWVNGATKITGADSYLEFNVNSARRLKLDANSVISLSNNDSGGTSGADGTSGNTLFGAYAGLNITTNGEDNSFFGHASGNKNTTGEKNVGFGAFTGFGNRTGDYNTYVGYGAGFGVDNNNHSYNVGVGSNALKDVTTGDSNVAVGSFALENNTTGVGNVAIGSWDSSTYQAPLTTNTVGSFNIAVGSGTLRLANDDSVDGSIGIGYGALNNQVGSSSNVQFANVATAVGYKALEALTTGTNNTAVGYLALSSNATGTGNVALGTNALKGGGNCSHNIAVGASSLFSVTTGAQNIVIGGSAGYTLSNSSYNVLIGHGAGNIISNNQTTTDGTTAVGNMALSSLTSGASNTAVGFEAGKLLTGGVNTIIGYQAADALASGTSNTVVGARAFGAADGSETNSVIIGADAGASINHDSTDGNVIIGHDAGTGGGAATVHCVVIGRNAMNSTGTNGSTGTVAIGYSALAALTDGGSNTAIGYQSLKADTTGDGNTFIGYNSGLENVSGSNCTVIGASAMDDSGDFANHNNTFIGKDCGGGTWTTTASTGNVAIGSGAMNLALNDADNNTIIGYGANPSAVGAQNQIAIGQGVTGQGNNSVTLGNTSVTEVYMSQAYNATVFCGGVRFPASFSNETNVNTLDDYEEGTFTPAIYYQNSDDMTNSTNVTQTGVYTKIGNVCHFQIYLKWNADNARVDDNIAISGMPFTSKNTTNLRSVFPVIVKGSSLVTDDVINGTIIPNGTLLYLQGANSNEEGNMGDDFGENDNMEVFISGTFIVE